MGCMLLHPTLVDTLSSNSGRLFSKNVMDSQHGDGSVGSWCAWSL